MTEPIDQTTKDLIEKEALAWISEERRINTELGNKLNELKEQLKQERNKAIDECIDAIFDKMIEVGPNKRFSYKECKTILQALKDQIHEPEAKTKNSQKPY